MTSRPSCIQTWPSRVLVVAAVVFTLFATAMPAARADWVSTNCSGSSSGLSSWSVSDAMGYSVSAMFEGYHWGGGCWNNNDIDDSPGEVPETVNPRGEGPDCSGFVTKTWAIQSSGTTAKTFYPTYYFYHGPYNTISYRSNTTAWTVIAKSSVSTMDALASSTHIGMLWSVNTNGTDQIMEAKGEAYGTNIWTRTYRSDPNFSAVHRNGWNAG